MTFTYLVTVIKFYCFYFVGIKPLLGKNNTAELRDDTQDMNSGLVPASGGSVATAQAPQG